MLQAYLDGAAVREDEVLAPDTGVRALAELGTRLGGTDPTQLAVRCRAFRRRGTSTRGGSSGGGRQGSAGAGHALTVVSVGHDAGVARHARGAACPTLAAALGPCWLVGEGTAACQGDSDDGALHLGYV